MLESFRIKFHVIVHNISTIYLKGRLTKKNLLYKSYKQIENNRNNKLCYTDTWCQIMILLQLSLH